MPRRLWTGVGALAVGAGLLATAQLAGAERGLRQGGVFRYGTSGASVQIDPQIAYVSTAWWLEYATAAKLVNYRDLRGEAGVVLRPEVASRYTVSTDGRTWTFVIRKGFRFSDGSPVTARSFAYAIDRVANLRLASPGAAFITDPNGANIVGARAVNDGKARHVSGVVVKGNRLRITLTRPDSTFATKLAMPFFQATSTKLPLDREVLAGYPSAGPYHFTANVVGERTELRRNPYYRGSRPRHLARLEVRWNLNEQAAYEQVRKGELDEGPLPAAEVQGVAAEFGVNRTRFWAKPGNCIRQIAFNRARPLLRGNVALRRAINWALDRKAFLGADYSGFPWTHLLPPGFPGAVITPKLQPYAGAPQLAKARALAAGHLRSGDVNIAYRSSTSTGAAHAQRFRDVLVELGIARQRIKLKGFSGGDIYDALGKPGSGLDFGAVIGWCSETLDPAGLVEPYAELRPKYAPKLAKARALHGLARLRAYGSLDIELMKDIAPVAVVGTYNNRFFFSARVDPRSLVFSAPYEDWSIPALALK